MGVLSKEFEDISHPRLLGLLALLLLLLKGFGDQLPLLALDVENSLFDRALHDQPPHGSRPSLTQAMNTVNGLILYGWCPPAVSQDDCVGRDQVQANAAYSQAGKHDACAGILVQGVDGGIALLRVHAAIDPCIDVACFIQLFLYDGEK